MRIRTTQDLNAQQIGRDVVLSANASDAGGGYQGPAVVRIVGAYAPDLDVNGVLTGNLQVELYDCLLYAPKASAAVGEIPLDPVLDSNGNQVKAWLYVPPVLDHDLKTGFYYACSPWYKDYQPSTRAGFIRAEVRDLYLCLAGWEYDFTFGVVTGGAFSDLSPSY